MISERLKAVAGMVTKRKKVADIGTDHGYVPIYLVENSICSKVYAMDINEGPLKIADKNIAIHGLSDKIETIQSNGMEKLKDNMVDGAIISGMGGDLIVDILSRGKNIKCINELVLSPHRRVDLVRKYLLENNWEIIDEKMLIDSGKYYTIIKALKNDEKLHMYSDVELKYGKILLDNKDLVLKGYLEKEYLKFAEIFEKMKANKSDNMQEVENIIYLNREAYRIYD